MDVFKDMLHPFELTYCVNATEREDLGSELIELVKKRGIVSVVVMLGAQV